MASQKDIEDFCASRNILAANINLFHSGHRDLYRVVAVELRKLLCDGKSSLVPRLSSGAMFHPLRGNQFRKEEECLVFHMPSVVRFDGKGGSRIVQLFDIKAEAIPLQAWLDQPLFSSEISIKELIRSVADKEAAHSDANYNSTLILTRSIKLIDEDVHKQHIVAIGEYILSMMTNTIQKYPNVFGALNFT